MRSALISILNRGLWSSSLCTVVAYKLPLLPLLPLIACALITLQFNSDVRAESRSQSKTPRRVLIAIGGGGEANDKVNQFDPYLNSISGLAQRGWETTLHYDFDHPSSKPVANSLKLASLANTRSLTERDVTATLVALKEEILSAKSELKKGDQVLISINTHGRQNADGNHSISLAGSGEMNLVPHIKDVIALAQKKGIKVGLTFDSCFSGNAIAEIERNIEPESDVCLISTSAANRISYGSSVPEGSLTESIRSAKTLEDGFLDFRTQWSLLNFDAPHLPSISSPAGRHAKNELRVITEYLIPLDTTSQPTNQLLCANPNSSLFPGITFRQSELQAATAKHSLKHYTNSKFEKVVTELQESKAKRDEADDALSSVRNFPGYDWSSCASSLKNVANSDFLEKLRIEYVSTLKTLSEVKPSRIFGSELSHARSGERARFPGEFPSMICDRIHDSGGLLDMSTAQAQLSEWQRIKSKTMKSETTRTQKNAESAVDPNVGKPTPRPTPSTASTSPTVIKRMIDYQKHDLEEMNALWRNPTVRQFLVAARKNRHALNEFTKVRDSMQKKLSSPESVILEREAWLQIYNNFKKKNPKERDPCAEFKI